MAGGFRRLYGVHQAGALYVTRAKSNLHAHRVYSAPTDRAGGVVADQTIALGGNRSSQDYPVHLRRIRFNDPGTGKPLVFLTNQTTLPESTICYLYKSRWQVELFFKWIKQHLRIKRFYGTSENAVKTQIWIAVSVYVLVAIVRKRLKLEASLDTLMQVLSVAIFEKMQIESAFFADTNSSEGDIENNQLKLFSFQPDSSDLGYRQCRVGACHSAANWRSTCSLSSNQATEFSITLGCCRRVFERSRRRCDNECTCQFLKCNHCVSKPCRPSADLLGGCERAGADALWRLGTQRPLCRTFEADFGPRAI